MIKRNYYQRGFRVFNYVFGFVLGWLIYDGFGWLGIGLAIIVAYLLLLGIPDFLTYWAGRRFKK